jgi:hypothetical protein
MALVVSGTAAAPLVVVGVSEILQARDDVNEGDSLRYAMILAASTVMTLGMWFMYRASRTGPADAQKVLEDFIAEHTRTPDADGRHAADGASG